MLKHWSMWFIVIGLGMDLLDTFTKKAGDTGGLLYGTNGPLAGVNNSIPGALNVGEAIASVGAVGLFLHHGKG